MRLLFAGTPDIAATALQALVNSEHEIVAVLTQPDARGKRGKTLHPSPVAQLADELGIDVLKPAQVKSPQAIAELKNYSFDAVAVVAYGQLISQEILDLAPSGFYNLHYSLLPKYRGAAPVQRALANGESETGISIFKLDTGMDSGKIAYQEKVLIDPLITAGELLVLLTQIGSSALVTFFDQLAKGQVELIEQDHTKATHAAKLTVAEAQLNPARSAFKLGNQIRAFAPNPAAYFNWQGKKIKVLKIGSAQPQDFGLPVAATPGSLGVSKKHLFLYATGGAVEISEVMPAGKKLMRAMDWARGQRIETGMQIDANQTDPPNPTIN